MGVYSGVGMSENWYPGGCAAGFGLSDDIMGVVVGSKVCVYVYKSVDRDWIVEDSILLCLGCSCLIRVIYFGGCGQAYLGLH